MKLTQLSVIAAVTPLLMACSSPSPFDVTVTPEVKDFGSHLFEFYRVDIVRTAEGSDVYQLDKVEFNSNSCGATSAFITSLNALPPQNKPKYTERGSKQSFVIGSHECKYITDVRVCTTDSSCWDYKFN